MRYSLNNYSNQVINGKKSIWLQNYGWAEAKPAEEFKPGEYFKWNYGSESKFIAIAKQTPKKMTVIEEWRSSFEGKYVQAQRTFSKSRWVAIGSGKNY
jgi:hypothetical protein